MKMCITKCWESYRKNKKGELTFQTQCMTQRKVDMSRLGFKLQFVKTKTNTRKFKFKESPACVTVYQ